MPTTSDSPCMDLVRHRFRGIWDGCPIRRSCGPLLDVAAFYLDYTSDTLAGDRVLFLDIVDILAIAISLAEGIERHWARHPGNTAGDVGYHVASSDHVRQTVYTMLRSVGLSDQQIDQLLER